MHSRRKIVQSLCLFLKMKNGKDVLLIASDRTVVDSLAAWGWTRPQHFRLSRTYMISLGFRKFEEYRIGVRKIPHMLRDVTHDSIFARKISLVVCTESEKGARNAFFFSEQLVTRAFILFPSLSSPFPNEYTRKRSIFGGKQTWRNYQIG